MKDWLSQAHVKWDCQYHVVIVPKYPRKVFSRRMRRGIGQILRDLCRQKSIALVEGKAMPDHIPILLSVWPQSSIAMTIGYLKRKSVTRIHRELLHSKRTLFGRSFGPGGTALAPSGGMRSRSGDTSVTRRNSNEIRTKVRRASINPRTPSRGLPHITGFAGI